MSEEQAKQLKQAIKEGVFVNKQGEVEFDKNLEKEIAGGVMPEQQEGEDGCSPSNNGCGNEINVGPLCGGAVPVQN